MGKGFLLVVEGLGGSGKSTVCDKAQQWFKEAGIPCTRTFEPGGTPAANHLRKLCREGIPDAEPLTPMAEAMLFNAARAQHVETVVKPALERGEVVLCDRYLLSTMGYQGVGRGLSIFTLKQIHHHAIGLVPDMTILMEGGPEVFVKRISAAEKGSDQFDNWNGELYNRIQFFFEREAAENKDRYWTVDAELPADGVFAQIVPLLMKIRDSLTGQPKHTESIKIPPKLQDQPAYLNAVPRHVHRGIKDTSEKVDT
jgi:dTMP kinase